MFKFSHLIVFSAALASPFAFAAQPEQEIVEHTRLMDHGDGHLMDMDGGMIMGQNKDKLPGGCDKISEDAEITVHAGHKYAKKFPGTMFAFDKQEWKFKPCTRLTVHFVNEDHIRHQWMMHGLPKYIYDKGMFHLEITGPAKISGTLILPKEDKTYLVHCDIAQHMEKGMKGQLVVGNGGGTFPSIPGLTDLAIPDDYGQPQPVSAAAASKPQPQVQPPQPKGQAAAPAGEKSYTGALIFGVILGAFGTPFVISNARRRFQGMSSGEIVGCAFSLARGLLDRLASWVETVYRSLSKGKQG
jgi:plastocyanin